MDLTFFMLFENPKQPESEGKKKKLKIPKHHLINKIQFIIYQEATGGLKLTEVLAPYGGSKIDGVSTAAFFRLLIYFQMLYAVTFVFHVFGRQSAGKSFLVAVVSMIALFLLFTWAHETKTVHIPNLLDAKSYVKDGT